MEHNDDKHPAAAGGRGQQRSGSQQNTPVFIVGCGRSGTTLLRMMLNTHPDLVIPQESHFVYQLARRRASGSWSGDLEDPREWEHFLSFLREHRYWAHWKLSFAELRERLEELPVRTHRLVFRTIFEQLVGGRSSLRWGDKTPMHVQYLLLLEQLFPDAQFVHVIRDGRDVAMSLMSRRWGPRHMSLAGYYWKWLTLSGAVSGAILGPKRYRELRFEDLLTNPEAELQSLCAWLGLEYLPELLDFHATEAASDYAKGGPVALRLKEPLDSSHTCLWKSNMSPRHQRSLVKQAGAALRYFGYPVDTLPRGQAREIKAITALLDPVMIDEIDQRAQARRGGEKKLQAALLGDRLIGTAAFLSGRLGSFGAAGVRWQRTVAGMMP